MPADERKEQIALRLDADVLAWYRAMGTGWQTRMNAVLKAFRDAQSSAAIGLAPNKGIKMAAKLIDLEFIRPGPSESERQQLELLARQDGALMRVETRAVDSNRRDVLN